MGVYSEEARGSAWIRPHGCAICEQRDVSAAESCSWLAHPVQQFEAEDALEQNAEKVRPEARAALRHVRHAEWVEVAVHTLVKVVVPRGIGPKDDAEVE